MSSHHHTIIVVDDDIALQAVLEYVLMQSGYSVLLASDGREGLKIIEHSNISLIISDIMMPDIDGIELFQLYKEKAQEVGIPVIIMTAMKRKPWFADLEAEGAVIIHKPFEVDKLLEVINVALSD